MSPKQIAIFGTKRQKAALKNHRRRANRGSKRMSAKQIKYFGTARQRAALKNRSRGAQIQSKGTSRRYRRASKRSDVKRTGRESAQAKYYAEHRRRRFESRLARLHNQGVTSKIEHAAQDALHAVERAAEDAIGAVRQSNPGRRGRRKNVSQILTVVPANPGRRRKRMAVKNRRRRRVALQNRRHRRRNSKVVVRYRNRHGRRHNRGHRRRNQGGIGGFLQGDAGAVVGILGGAALTKLVGTFLPSSLATGWTGYIANSVVAVVGGNTVGRFMNNRRLGNWMTIGGLVMVGLQILADNFPQLALPFTVSSGTSGMGLITSSNFYVPQVNMPGSMASFVTPAGLPAPVVVPTGALKGFGATGTSAMNSGLRRVGRLR